MRAACYDPSEAVAFWKTLGKTTDDSGPTFLSTHPSHASREQAMLHLLKDTSSSDDIISPWCKELQEHFQQRILSRRFSHTYSSDVLQEHLKSK